MLNYTQFDEDQVEFVHVANVGELDDEGRLLLEIDGQQIALFMVSNKIFAIADICSHDDGCPRHGAHFDLHTGKALSLPAVVDIPAFPVKIDGEEILVGVPIES
jgi:3-phenylpropionate/trans-cinnamate dioxygenase ferredoxin subunit